VLAVARTIATHMNGYKVVIDKSTVPVGTADKVRAVLQQTMEQRGASVPFDVVSNPEFLKEGAAIEDFSKPARIVIGTDSERVEKLMRECYAPYNRNHDKMIIMDVRSAELTKYAANAMLATKISFMNEMANLAERLGADIEAVRIGIGSDPRIGYHFIYPGAGYGGSCFPKDVQALARTASQTGYEAKLLNAVEAVNDAVRAAAHGPLAGILAYSDEQLVSIDFNHNASSSIVDTTFTRSVSPKMHKVLAWYDNEWGYASRLADLIARLGGSP